jgi:hypothetical protein
MPVTEERTTERKGIYIPTAIAYPVLLVIISAVATLFLKVNTLEQSGMQRETRISRLEQKLELAEGRVTALQIDVITKLSEIKLLIEQQKNDKVPASRTAYR